jgi:hypothetical protein
MNWQDFLTPIKKYLWLYSTFLLLLEVFEDILHSFVWIIREPIQGLLALSLNLDSLLVKTAI